MSNTPIDRLLRFADQAGYAAEALAALAQAWDEGMAAGLDTGLTIAELRSGPIDLSKVPPPPTNPYTPVRYP